MLWVVYLFSQYIISIFNPSSGWWLFLVFAVTKIWKYWVFVYKIFGWWFSKYGQIDPSTGPRLFQAIHEVRTILIMKQRHTYFFHCVELCTAGIKARQAKWLVSYTNQGSGITSGHCIPYYFTRGLKTLLKNINFLNVSCYILIYLMFCVSQWKVNTKYCVVCLSATVSQGKVLVQFFELQDEQEFFFVEYFYLKE